ncbi:hypothetical protein F383_13439 [Gossypium arboreum]|uniref:Uncharacterized protein n=1 Tax=Gossypium arboreum TaxID=29729 RepID=A0A0B0NCH2_GOSAR|nr:hypothetical protein F383_13439 [Gossypium arboreum]
MNLECLVRLHWKMLRTEMDASICLFSG